MPPPSRPCAPPPPDKSAMTTPHMATTTLRVEGMTCGACTSSVEAAFASLPGVASVSVSLVMERAVVVHDPARVSPERVRQLIEERGFDAEVLASDIPLEEVEESDGEDALLLGETDKGLVTTTVAVGGMTCGACTAAVEGAFRNVAGVRSFSISLLAERAVVEHDASVLPPARIAEIIEDAGFEATVTDTQTAEAVAQQKRRRKGAAQQSTLSTTVAIGGMTCGACTAAVEGGFRDLDGVMQFNISLLAERAVVVHDPVKLSAQRVAEIIEERGFDARIVSSVDVLAQSTANATSYLKVYGMRDVEAASGLEALITGMAGVSAVSVSFLTSRAAITHRPATVGLRAIVEAVEAAGYNALVADADDNNAQLESLAKTKEIQEWRRAFHTSVMFALPVFFTSMVFPMLLPFLDYGSIPLTQGLWLGDVVCLALTIPVQFGIGRRFYISAYKSMRHGSPTMDVLVVLGTSAAFFFSVAAMLVSLIYPPHSRPSTVFDTSSMLITFITLGRYIENRAKGQTSKALSHLMSLAPSMATIYTDPIAAAKAAEEWDSYDEKASGPRKSISGDSSAERVIPTELIEVGDVVLLRPGDKIPADGTVLRGESYVNESMVTGEAMPILKKKDSLLMAGTVNGEGRVDFLVTRAGRDTQLSQIVRLVQEAQTSRAPIQRIADQVAGVFVSVIITLGAATFVAWMILSHFLPTPPPIFLAAESGGKTMVCVKLCISVIVFACPCALGLSTPTAVMVGTGVGAEKGILIKGGAALETATKITHVVFDKTGTLTVGHMRVSRASITSSFSAPAAQRLWWTLVGLAEMSSEHPVARAIVAAAREHLHLGTDAAPDGSAGDFEAVVGKGIIASVEAAIDAQRTRHRVVLGNPSFLAEQGVPVPVDTLGVPAADGAGDSTDTLSAPHPSRLPSAGTTTIHVAIDGAYAGSLALSDTLKPSARACVLALSRLGISSSIVTGDALAPALIVAAQVGIPPSAVHASCTPSTKRSLIETLQLPTSQGGKGQVVAMVGDGINDSPALATAAIGIALSSGTDVAMEAADVVLMSSTSSDLLAVPAALHLSRAIFGRIRANLIWACGYNLVGLPFAMGFFLPWGLSLHPMAAGAAMACSSVSVVCSSLALRWWRRPRWMSVAVLDPERAGQAGEKVEPAWEVREWIGGLVERVKGGRGARRGSAAYVPLRDLEV